jgi:CDP-glucose 4,6-dehydratase
MEGLALTERFGGAFQGKRVLVTGHTGFKGSWLSLWLDRLGAAVTGYALDPPTTPSNFVASRVDTYLSRHIIADIRDLEMITQVVREADPDVIFHLAAQPLVRESYRDPVTTVATNVIGTVNLLEAVRARGKRCAVVVVTSDKCYENREWLYGYRETDPMGGHDPYSMSKGATELAVASWRASFFPPAELSRHGICMATVRAGNVIGGGDWQQDRILVDCIRSLQAGQPIDVRCPSATRPWQHVLEPLGGYLLLASKMLTAGATQGTQLADAWNFGPEPSNCWTVARLVEEVILRWGMGSWRVVPTPSALHEAGFLGLCCDKVFRGLQWRPVWDVRRAVAETVAWYRAFQAGANVGDLCKQQIGGYCDDACRLVNPWMIPVETRVAE